MLELPLTGRRIPLITDEWAKPELGSGCVKITPAHDANDYDVWQRHPEIGVIDHTQRRRHAERQRTRKIPRPEGHQGPRSSGRRHGSRRPLVEIEDREIDLAHSDRSKKPIEPCLADQWFMKMGEDEIPLPPREGPGEGSSQRGLAQTAMDAVTTGRVKIVPERYAKGYLDWLGEKRDWPIGRQLWWGHRIPVWSIAADQFYKISETENADKEFSYLFQAAGEEKIALSMFGKAINVADPSLPQLLENQRRQIRGSSVRAR